MIKTEYNHSKVLLQHSARVVSLKFFVPLKRKLSWKEEFFSTSCPEHLQCSGKAPAKPMFVAGYVTNRKGLLGGEFGEGHYKKGNIKFTEEQSFVKGPDLVRQAR